MDDNRFLESVAWSRFAFALRRHLRGRRVALFHQHAVDEPAWRRLAASADAYDFLSVAFDSGPAADLLRHRRAVGSASHLALQHETITLLQQPDSQLSRLIDEFDPDGTALLIFCDPLRPTVWGHREVLAPPNPLWNLWEDKTRVDELWDLIDLPRAHSTVVSHGIATNTRGSHDGVSAGLDTDGGGVVIALSHGAGGEGLWWYPPSTPLPTWPSARLRIMPILYGIPCRLHGIVTPTSVASLPPLELIVLRRPTSHTFLCCGSAPIPPSSVDTNAHDLLALTHTIGERLARWVGYRGAFAVDGVLTAEGFRPTELNTRLTSAVEQVSPTMRTVALSASLLARSETEWDPTDVQSALADALTNADDIHIFAASATATPSSWGTTTFRWSHITAPAEAHGTLNLQRSARGWSLHAQLARHSFPAVGPVSAVAPAILGLADHIFGTDFGDLKPPFGIRPSNIPRLVPSTDV